MIVSFKSKGLKQLFLNGDSTKLPPERVDKIRGILSMMHAAVDINDLRIPAFRLHVLKGPPYQGFYSIDVTRNYRIIFRFEQGKIYDVDYLDTH
jgi:toxin HigB-1